MAQGSKKAQARIMYETGLTAMKTGVGLFAVLTFVVVAVLAQHDFQPQAFRESAMLPISLAFWPLSVLLVLVGAFFVWQGPTPRYRGGPKPDLSSGPRSPKAPKSPEAPKSPKSPKSPTARKSPKAPKAPTGPRSPKAPRYQGPNTDDDSDLPSLSTVVLVGATLCVVSFIIAVIGLLVTMR